MSQIARTAHGGALLSLRAALVASAAACLCPAVAAAQEAQPAPAASAAGADGVGNEILVTATKREQTLQSVPVAVTDAAYPPAADHGAALLQLMAAPNIASKRWAWEQYDYIVQANTVQIPGSDAAVLRIKDTTRGFAFSNDCNGRHCYLDPYRGAKAATAEAARNLACTGALPVAVTDCLNFGNPEKGETPYMFVEAVEGMAEACEALQAPVVSGNVSLYNEHSGGPIPPAPIVGCVGLIEDAGKSIGAAPRNGASIVLLGDAAPAVDGSEYQAELLGGVAGRIPDIDLAAEARLIDVLVEAAASGISHAAHDAAEGGIAVAAAEMAIAGKVGIGIELPPLAERDDITLFGEAGNGHVLVATDDADALLALAAKHGVPALVVGTAGGDAIRVAVGPTVAELPLAAAVASWSATMPALIGAA